MIMSPAAANPNTFDRICDVVASDNGRANKVADGATHPHDLFRHKVCLIAGEGTAHGRGGERHNAAVLAYEDNMNPNSAPVMRRGRDPKQALRDLQRRQIDARGSIRTIVNELELLRRELALSFHPDRNKAELSHMMASINAEIDSLIAKAKKHGRPTL